RPFRAEPQLILLIVQQACYFSTGCVISYGCSIMLPCIGASVIRIEAAADGSEPKYAAMVFHNIIYLCADPRILHRDECVGRFLVTAQPHHGAYPNGAGIVLVNRIYVIVY